MARKATKVKKKIGNKSYASRKKNKEIWASGTPEKWHTYASQNDARGKDRKTKFTSTSITAECINGHSDSNPSMVINPQKGFVKCYSCGYYECSPLRFWSKYTGHSIGKVISDFKAEFGVDSVSTADGKAAEDEYTHVKRKNGIASVLNDELVAAVQEWKTYDGDIKRFEDKAAYGFSHYTIQLLEDRGLIDYVHMLPLGLFVKTLTLSKLCESYMHKGTRVFDTQDLVAIEKYFDSCKKEYYLGSLVMVYHSTPVDVSRFRLRTVKGESKEKGILSVPDDREEKLGVFGLGMYSHLTGKGSNNSGEGIGNTTKCVFVEGEFDQMQYAVRAAEVGNNDLVVLSHSGATSRDISEIVNFGLKHVYYLPDNDAGGDENAKELMKLNPAIDFKIFIWPTDILDSKKPKMDLDDALNLYGFQTVHDKLIDWDKNWVKPAYWCKEQIKNVIARKGIEADDVNSISKTIFSYASCVRGSDAKDVSYTNSWINDTLESHGIDRANAKNLTNEFLSKDSDESVFIQQITKALKEAFDFISVDRQASTIPIKVWSKKVKAIMDLRTGSDASLRASMVSALGSSLEWAKEKIAVPSFVKYTEYMEGDEPAERSIIQQDEEISRYIVHALKGIISFLPCVSEFRTYTAGCHWLATPKGNAMFCVNGNVTYKTTFAGGIAETEVLPSPVYGRHLFHSANTKWSDFITSDSYGKPQRTTLKERVLKIEEILKVGWGFQSPDTEAMGLAAFVAASSIIKIFPKNMQFLASNERSTGKSTLYAELVGGGKSTSINLVEHSRFVDNATPAGVRQSMDGSSLILCLDEFDNEAGSGRRSEKNGEIMLILRASSEGEGVMSQGTASGRSRDFHLSFSAFVSGIDPSIEEANMTRFFTTDLQAGLDNRKPPATSILNAYTQKEIDDLRRDITLDSLHDVPTILQAYNEVKHVCDKNPSILGEDSLQRFKDNMYVLASIIHAAGLDWETWCRNTYNAKKGAIKSLKKRTANEQLYSTVFGTSNVIVAGTTGKRRSVRDFFSTIHKDTELVDLNDSACGVSFHMDELHDKWYALVLWQEALSGVLKGTTVARTRHDPYSLETTANRHPTAIKGSSSREIVHRLPNIDAWVGQTQYTLFDITSQVMAELDKNERVLNAPAARKTPTGEILTSEKLADAKTVESSDSGN